MNDVDDIDDVVATFHSNGFVGLLNVISKEEAASALKEVRLIMILKMEGRLRKKHLQEKNRTISLPLPQRRDHMHNTKRIVTYIIYHIHYLNQAKT